MDQRTQRAMQSFTQQISPPRLVIDLTDQRILDGDPTTGHLCVVMRGLESFADLPPVVDRHQRVAQFVVGRMQ